MTPEQVTKAAEILAELRANAKVRADILAGMQRSSLRAVPAEIEVAGRRIKIRVSAEQVATSLLGDARDMQRRLAELGVDLENDDGIAA